MFLDQCRTALAAAQAQLPAGLAPGEAVIRENEKSSAFVEFPGGSAFFAKRFGGAVGGRGGTSRLFSALGHPGDHALRRAGDIVALPVFIAGNDEIAFYDRLTATHRLDVALTEERETFGGALSKIGRTLAVLHSLSDEVLPLYEANMMRPLPPQYNFFEPALDAFVDGPGADYENVIRYAQNFEGAAAGAAALSEEGRIDALTHNDVKFDNIFVDPSARFGLRLTDVDDVGPGDRAWDVGCAVGDTLKCWLDGLTIHDIDDLEEAISSAKIPFDTIIEAIGVMLSSYMAEAPGGEQILSRKSQIVRYAGKHLMNTALSVLFAMPRLTRSQWARLHIGLTLLASPEEQAELLFSQVRS